MKVVVFDFDNTLIIGDATSSIIKESLNLKGNSLRFWVFILTWANRLRLMKSCRYKQIVYNLLFKNRQDYYSLIPEDILWDNRVLDKLKRYIDCPNTISIVSTASDEKLVGILLKKKGIKVRVIGTQFSWQGLEGVRLNSSNFGREKVVNLKNIEIGHIDFLYTDHFIADYHLVKYATHVILVNRGLIKGMINRIASFFYPRIEFI